MKKMVFLFGLALLLCPTLAQALNAFSERFTGVNYGPFHKDGQAPGNPIPPEQIRDDLKIMAEAKFTYIKTYAVDDGIDQIVYLAQQHYPHLKICIGVHESSVDHDNPNNPHSTLAQLNKAVALANQYPNVAGIVVGNECLKGDPQAGNQWVAAQTLLNDLAYVRQNLNPSQKSKVVLTSDLTFAAAHGDTSDDGGNIRDQLKANCNNIDIWMINIYPWYKPGGIDCTESALRENLDWNFNEFTGIYGATGRPIMIGETGWPTAGSPNGKSIPSIDNQRTYTKVVCKWLTDRKWRGFLFEMFDEPWKINEGDNGPHWGLYNKNGQAKWPGSPWAPGGMSPGSHLLLDE
jgi:exo-beta-1,3-glucanase (GH17 family)